MPAPIELYYWPTPNGWKASIALEEMALPYRLTLVNINKGEQFEPGFEAISPNSRIPAIVDPEGPDGKPISIFESGAILLYLARKTGKLVGQTARDLSSVEQWLFWQVGGVGPIAGQVHHFVNYAPEFDPPQVLPYAQQRYIGELERLYQVLDKRLSGSEYIAGDFFSIADIALWSWSHRWRGQQQSIDDKPNMARWLDLVADRPAVQRGRQLRADLRGEGKVDKEAQEKLFRVKT